MHILITGAGGFVGSSLVGHLSQKHNVIAITRNEADLNHAESVKRFFSSLKKLDVLINCAGILGPVGKFEDNDLDKWQATINTNLLGTAYCTYYALGLLLKSPQGKIINFAGGGAANARSHHSAYACSKTAVVRFTETLALEYRKLEINAIAPGAHPSQMWEQENHDTRPERWGDLDKLKDFIDFLLSDQVKGVSGKFLHYLDDRKKIVSSKNSDLFTLRRVE